MEHRNFLDAKTPTATTYTYDDLNRAVSVTYPVGSADQSTYNGLMVTRANAKSQTIASYSHANGAVAETEDALGNATNYAVGAFGTVRSVTDPADRVSCTYNTLGHRLTKTDPDTNTNGAPERRP